MAKNIKPLSKNLDHITNVGLCIKLNEAIEQINHLTKVIESNGLHIVDHTNRSPYDLSSHPLKRKKR